jgi:hypothetical protein
MTGQDPNLSLLRHYLVGAAMMNNQYRPGIIIKLAKLTAVKFQAEAGFEA